MALAELNASIAASLMAVARLVCRAFPDIQQLKVSVEERMAHGGVGTSMDNEFILIIGIVAGFSGGYGVRAMVSHCRRAAFAHR